MAADGGTSGESGSGESGGEAGAGSSGGSSRKISRISKGDKGRTMMRASVANEVIDRVNENDAGLGALKNLSVSPADAGEFKWSDSNVVLVLKKTGSGGEDNLETVTGAINGVPSTLQVQTDGNGWTAV